MREECGYSTSSRGHPPTCRNLDHLCDWSKHGECEHGHVHDPQCNRFPRHDKRAAVGIVPVCVQVMSVSTGRGDQNIDTSRSSVVQTWTQRQMINFPCRKCFSDTRVTGDSSHTFSNRSSFLASRVCGQRQLDVTVGCVNLRTRLAI